MVAIVKQIVTVRAGGEIRLRSKELKAGDKAEVIVRVTEPPKPSRRKSSKNGSSRSKSHDYPIARMTKQVRGDIAEAKRAQKAIREGKEKLIPWEQVKRELGLK